MVFVRPSSFSATLRFLDNFIHAFWGSKNRARSGWSMRATRRVKARFRNGWAAPKHLLWRPSSVVVGDLPTCAAIQQGNNCWLANECPQNEVAKVLLRARRKSFSVPWPMYKPRRTRLVALIDHPDRARLHLSANKRFFEGSAAPPASRGAPKTPPQHLR